MTALIFVVLRQAEVIRAQQANLDAARAALREIGYYTSEMYVLRIVREALEGVEPEEQPMVDA